jgi:hypothetical protein
VRLAPADPQGDIAGVRADRSVDERKRPWR